MDEFKDVEKILKSHRTIGPPDKMRKKIMNAAARRRGPRWARGFAPVAAAAAIILAVVLAVYFALPSSDDSTAQASKPPATNKIGKGNYNKSKLPEFVVMPKSKNTETNETTPSPIPPRIQRVFASESDAAAVVADVFGDVRVSGDAAWTGLKIAEGELIETSENSMVMLIGRDKSKFKLNVSTSVNIRSLSKKRIVELMKGEVFVSAAPVSSDMPESLVVKTPHADATVRGTQFSVRSISAASFLSVRSGVVEFSNDRGSAKVSASEQAVAAAGASPRVQRLIQIAERFRWTNMLADYGRHSVEKASAGNQGGSGTAAIGSIVARRGESWQQLSLKSQKVSVVVDSGIATTRIEQVFYNNTGAELEGSFTFPLPKDASISYFAMTVDRENKNLVQGSIVERKYARQVFDSLIRRRIDPGLLEWQAGSTFSMRIYPIFPNCEKHVVIAYTQPVPFSNGKYTYVFPLGGSLSSDAAPKDFQLAAMVRCADAVSNLECPSHNVAMESDSARQVRVGFEAADYAPKNNFTLTWSEVTRRTEARASGGTGGYFIARLRPDLSKYGAEIPKRFVYVLDTSASVKPNEREIAYNVLEKLLETLSEDQEFRLAFSDYYTVFPQKTFVKATSGNIAEALMSAWAVEQSGATNLGKLASALAGELEEGSGAAVIYIGDGKATMGETRLADLADIFRKKLAGRVSAFHAVGVGGDVDENMLRGISNALGGTCFTLRPGDDLMLQIRLITLGVNMPILTGAKIEFPDGVVSDVHPREIPPIPFGSETIILGRANAGGDIRAALTGLVNGRSYTEEIVFKTENGSDKGLLARTWAEKRLSDLILENTGEKNANEIIALSKEFSIITPYTSLLVLDTEEQYQRFNIERAKVYNRENSDISEKFDVTMPKGADKWAQPAEALIKQEFRKQKFDETLELSTQRTPQIIVDRIVERPEITLEEETEITMDIPRGTSFENISNKNLNSNSAIDAFGIGGGAAGAYGSRWGRGSFANEGGSIGTEDSVNAALRWLYFHQDADGRWDIDGFSKNCKRGTCEGEGVGKNYDVGATGLALLAFLGNGHTHQVGEFKKTVRRGLRFLKTMQSIEGRFGPAEGEGWFYNHAIALCAVCEAYAMTRDDKLKEMAVRGLKFALDAKNPDAGWKYEPKSGKSDTSVTGWMVLALKAARTAGLEVPNKAFEDAQKWFDRVTASNGRCGYERPGDPGSRLKGQTKQFERQETMTAVALYCRLLMGQKRADWQIRKGVELVMSKLPYYDEPNHFKVNYYYWYYGTNAMFQYGGEQWKKWNEAMKSALVKTQRRGGCTDGSWDPVDEWSAVGGRVYATAMNALTLQIYYRYRRQVDRNHGVVVEPPEPKAASYQEVLGNSSMAALIEKARAEKSAEILDRIETLISCYPSDNTSLDEWDAISAQKDAAVRVLDELWPMDAEHTGRLAAIYMWRFNDEDAVRMLLADRNGKCRLGTMDLMNLKSDLRCALINILSEIVTAGNASDTGVEAAALTAARARIVEILVKAFPYNQNYDLFIGETLGNSSNSQNAFKAITSLLDANPNDLNTLTRVARILDSAGLDDEAAELYEQAWRVSPGNGNNWEYLEKAAGLAASAGEKGFERAERLYLAIMKGNLLEKYNGYYRSATEGLEKLYTLAQSRVRISDVKTAAKYARKLKDLQKGVLVTPDLRVILTWNNIPDLDLHVCTPEDNECDYTNKKSSRGGVLDMDVTKGFGPETYTLVQIRPGKYSFSVKYFAGGAVARGTVEIILYEGAENETRIKREFTLEKRGDIVEVFSGNLK